MIRKSKPSRPTPQEEYLAKKIFDCECKIKELEAKAQKEYERGYHAGSNEYHSKGFRDGYLTCKKKYNIKEEEDV